MTCADVKASYQYTECKCGTAPLCPMLNKSGDRPRCAFDGQENLS